MYLRPAPVSQIQRWRCITESRLHNSACSSAVVVVASRRSRKQCSAIQHRSRTRAARCAPPLGALRACMHCLHRSCAATLWPCCGHAPRRVAPLPSLSPAACGPAAKWCVPPCRRHVLPLRNAHARSAVPSLAFYGVPAPRLTRLAQLQRKHREEKLLSNRDALDALRLLGVERIECLRVYGQARVCAAGG